MATRWRNMEEVQADLARATGQRIPLVDEGCLVYGERPPPMLTTDEDTEEEHQLRSAAGAAGAMVSQPSPDLRGITNMLRMIQSYGNHDAPSSSAPTDEVLVISKPAPLARRPDPVVNQSTAAAASISSLNPNVKEFVPRVATGNTELGAADAMTEEQLRERAELASMLRSQIRASPDDDPLRRRERYEAIAGLLRLHCTPAAGPAPAPALRTPDYFRTHRVPSLPEPAAGASEEEDETAADELQMRASIGKVSAWLQGERAAPAPAPEPALPHLGPITYRRRSPAPAATPRELAARARVTAGDERYVPSAGARALSAEYAARAAAASPSPPTSLWERLERDLRRRDAEAASDRS